MATNCFARVKILAAKQYFTLVSTEKSANAAVVQFFVSTDVTSRRHHSSISLSHADAFLISRLRATELALDNVIRGTRYVVANRKLKAIL